jgi:anti-anti-sigma factor
MEPEFDVQTARLENDAFVVSVKGEADLNTATELERELQDVLRLGGRSVTVDLAEVGFIDSTALALLLRFQPQFKARGGDLVVVSDDRRVLRTFEITGLDRILRIERRLGDAVRPSSDGAAVAASAAEPA